LSVPLFLSPEWLESLSQLLGELEWGDGAPLALGQLVTGGPDGDVGYTIHLGPQARVESGIDGAEVVLLEGYGTARALAAGELTAADALTAGSIKVRGNAKRLVESTSLLSLLAGAASELRAATTF
jgi:hypothetical protein